ncbi:hypothetical protein CBR_g52007 [Chara braunii]|uniref:Uncharacterized protein n=1 Tax=Chara braunii TaxID=69332 RepID=A0A388K6Q1_CHABU|nr:hypothetical protein CBR_g52007 [Chara braunii]|eukprot:GBG65706.1 hypothetical protein CBR_g52007 [Chara braunii]
MSPGLGPRLPLSGFYNLTVIPGRFYSVRLCFGFLSGDIVPVFNLTLNGAPVGQVPSAEPRHVSESGIVSLKKEFSVYVNDSNIWIGFMSIGRGEPRVNSIEILQLLESLAIMKTADLNLGIDTALELQERVNCGGGKVTENATQLFGWEPDDGYLSVTAYEHNQVENSPSTIAESDDLCLSKNESDGSEFFSNLLFEFGWMSADVVCTRRRGLEEGTIAYQFPLAPARQYLVILYFSEGFSSETIAALGDRVIDVIVTVWSPPTQLSSQLLTQHASDLSTNATIDTFTHDYFMAVLPGQVEARNITVLLRPNSSSKSRVAIVNGVEIYGQFPMNGDTLPSDVDVFLAIGQQLDVLPEYERDPCMSPPLFPVSCAMSTEMGPPTIVS